MMKKIEKGLGDVEIEVKRWVQKKPGIIHINEFYQSLRDLKKNFDRAAIVENPFSFNSQELSEFFWQSKKLQVIYKHSTSVKRINRYRDEVGEIECIMDFVSKALFAMKLFNFIDLGVEEAIRQIDVHKNIYHQTGIFNLGDIQVDNKKATPIRINEVFLSVNAIEKFLLGFREGQINSIDFNLFKTEFLKTNILDYKNKSLQKGSEEFEVLVDECVKMFDTFTIEEKRREYIGFWKNFINRYGESPTIFLDLNLDGRLECMYFVSVGVRTFKKLPDEQRGDFLVFAQHLFRIIHVSISCIRHEKLLQYEKAGIQISIDSITRDLARFERTGYLEFNGKRYIAGISDKQALDRTLNELKGFKEDLLAIARSTQQVESDSSKESSKDQNKSIKGKTQTCNSNKKYRWLGTPAQLAFITDLLSEKKWLTLTASGEENAKILLSIFDFDGHTPSPGSLGKCFQKLKKDELPINIEAAKKFQKFPSRSEL